MLQEAIMREQNVGPGEAALEAKRRVMAAGGPDLDYETRLQQELARRYGIGPGAAAEEVRLYAPPAPDAISLDDALRIAMKDIPEFVASRERAENARAEGRTGTAEEFLADYARRHPEYVDGGSEQVEG
jgi:hypothetical protein